MSALCKPSRYLLRPSTTLFPEAKEAKIRCFPFPVLRHKRLFSGRKNCSALLCFTLLYSALLCSVPTSVASSKSLSRFGKSSFRIVNLVCNAVVEICFKTESSPRCARHGQCHGGSFPKDSKVTAICLIQNCFSVQKSFWYLPS